MILTLRNGAAYRVLSAVVLCGALVAWAGAIADLVRIPAVHSLWFGLTLWLAGATIGFAGPRLFPHPVYTGFCIACAGVSIAAGSASGLWLVSPLVALSCVALVLRFEPREQVLPQPGTAPPTANDRLRFYLFVLLPWLALYEVILAIGIPPDAVSGMSRFEQRLPVLEWTQIIYASTYFLTILAPVFAKTRSDLRNYSVRGLWTMLIAYPAFLLIPLIAPKRPFLPQTLPGRLLLWERSLDSPVAAFPSFHVIWAMLAARVFASRWPRMKGLFYGWAILVAASCVTTSQHSILDVLGGAATVALVVRIRRVPIMSPGGWSLMIVLILTRLWLLAAPLHLIAGLCLILVGLGSLMEETKRTAVAAVIAGVLLTALGHSAPAPGPHFSWNTLLPAVVIGLTIAIVAVWRYRESRCRASIPSRGSKGAVLQPASYSPARAPYQSTTT